jgi:tetratricopeptide (TPR) repeat protein
MRRTPGLPLLAASLFLATAGPAAAQRSTDLQDCLFSANFETIVRACNAVIEAGKDPPVEIARAYIGRAGRLLIPDEDGRFRVSESLDRAIADFSEAIKLDPTLPEAFAARASAWHKKREYQRAVADYDEAIRTGNDGPHFAYYHERRGVVLLDAGEFDRAIADFNAAIAREPIAHNHVGALHHRGVAYRAKRDFDRAAADFGALVALQWNVPLALANRGWVFLLKGDRPKAATDFEFALSKMQDKGALVLALYGRGLAKKESGDVVSGGDDMDAAAAIDRQLVLELAKLGTALLRDDAQKAVVRFDASLKTMQDRKALALALYGIGIMRTRGGDGTRGLAEITAAKIVDPTITEAVRRERLD